MLLPEIMAKPAHWLLSEEAATVNGRRFVAGDWDASLSDAEAAEKAGGPIAWGAIAQMPIEPA